MFTCRGSPDTSALASIDARSGGSTGPSPEMSSGPLRRFPPGAEDGSVRSISPVDLERDPKRPGRLRGVGALGEQLGGGQALGTVLTVSVSAASAPRGETGGERQDEERPEQGAERARHCRGIAWPAMRGRPDGT